MSFSKSITFYKAEYCCAECHDVILKANFLLLPDIKNFKINFKILNRRWVGIHKTSCINRRILLMVVVPY
jgi:hypothetical protein